MVIPETAYEQILREYDAKQLSALREQRLRTRKIESRIPELSDINSRITQLSADMAVDRIRGNKENAARMALERLDLIRKRERLLNAAGFSLSDLEPEYECSLCNDTGYVDNEMCRCLKDRIIEVLYDQSNIRDILEKENFDTYTLKYYSDVPMENQGGESPLNIAKKALATARDFVNHFEDNDDNLFISGETGTGKTFLCNCIARASLDRGFSVIYLSAAKLFDILAAGMFSGNDQQRSYAGELYSCDLLIIDDLGTEYANSFTQPAFFNCINERLMRKVHTIISTNLSIQQIRSDYSERIFSRIAEKYTFIKLFGEDIRIIKKLEE